MRSYTDPIQFYGLYALLIGVLAACAPYEETPPAYESQIIHYHNNMDHAATVATGAERKSLPLSEETAEDELTQITMKPEFLSSISHQNNEMKMASDITQFSNSNVTVYSLNQPVHHLTVDGGQHVRVKTDYPGGHVVFDKSVTVYSVDKNLERPDFMSEYAVPTYGVPVANRLTPMPMDVISSNDSSHRKPVMLKPSNMLNDEDILEGRRGPMLTSYK